MTKKTGNITKKISWICFDCGAKYGRRKDFAFNYATCHYDVCDICGNNTAVTEPRDFGGLVLERIKPKKEKK